MMAVEFLFLTSSSLFILLLPLLLFQTSLANPHCTPSACGIFPNISSPLRLKGDPNHCGYVELACENNVTSFYHNSHKFYVKEINYTDDAYPYATIRVVDASINNDICSFPTATYIGHRNYPLYLRDWYDHISFISCPHPLKNSSGFTETTPCQTPNSSRFTYIKVGAMNAFEVPETCRVDVVTMTSGRGFKDFNDSGLSWYEFNDFKNTSLEEINSALLYGFELDIDPNWSEATKWDIFVQKLQDYYIRVRQPLLILLPFAVVFGAAISPVMAIIGFIVILAFILSSANLGPAFDPLHIYSGFSGNTNVIKMTSF